MTFNGRKIADIKDTSDQTQAYAARTDSIIKFHSTIKSDLVVEFKAFITELSDNFQSNWETEEVYGRMDPIGTFKNTKRAISLSWVVPANSIEEAKSNLDAVRNLTSLLYPGYSANQVKVSGQEFTTANSISKPPLIRLSYNNLIKSAVDTKGLLGWVEGFNVSHNVELGYFIENKMHYPKSYSLSCNFNVLHEHDLGWNTSGWISNKASTFPFGSGNGGEEDG